MPKKEAPISELEQFLPDGTYAPVLDYLKQYQVHLTITRERKTLLGDYRHRTLDQNHRISVNGNLNNWWFLITLLHELAHLLTFEKFGNRVAAHGIEWKKIYATLLEQFLKNHVFPEDIETALMQSLRNPAASSCAEEGLVRILRRYDKGRKQGVLVEDLPEGAVFSTPDGRQFQRGPRLRKRFQCKETGTGKLFLFSPVYEVELPGNT